METRNNRSHDFSVGCSTKLKYTDNFTFKKTSECRFFNLYQNIILFCDNKQDEGNTVPILFLNYDLIIFMTFTPGVLWRHYSSFRVRHNDVIFLFLDYTLMT